MDLEMVSYLSKLGKLSFTDEELKKTAEEMTSIIEIMDTIKEIDVEYNALADNKNVYLNNLREDESEASMPTEKYCKMQLTVKTVLLFLRLLNNSDKRLGYGYYKT